jgi:RimJ/RimL family protein N-acetyltransferase
VSVLETPRLRLRLLHEEGEGDVALYVHLYTDSAVMRCIAPPFDSAVAADAFARACRHNRAGRPGHRTWRIDDRATGDDLGIAALQRAGDAAELGVVLREAAWGRGIGREALGAVLDHAFAGLGLALVFGERPDDDQARRVDRMFAPLGLRRVVAPSGRARWELPRARWSEPHS